MTKQEFIKKYASKCEITEAQSKKYVDAFLETLTDALVNDLDLEESDRVSFKKFGSFRVRLGAKRKSINPYTGKKQIIPEKFRISFIPSDILKEAVGSRKK